MSEKWCGSPKRRPILPAPVRHWPSVQSRNAPWAGALTRIYQQSFAAACLLIAFHCAYQPKPRPTEGRGYLQSRIFRMKRLMEMLFGSRDKQNADAAAIKKEQTLAAINEVETTRSEERRVGKETRTG